MVFCFHLKPAPEQQRLDDAIGLLRDHAEINVSIAFFLNEYINVLSLLLSQFDFYKNKISVSSTD